MSDIHVLRLSFKDQDFSIIENIRKKVFLNEMNISESELFDENDETCEHYILFDGKEAVGSVRFLKMNNEIKLERMAILSDFRREKLWKICNFTISRILSYDRLLQNDSRFYSVCKGFL